MISKLQAINLDPRNLMDGFQEREGFRAFLRQVQADQQAGIVFALQLALGVGQLVVQVVDIGVHFGVKLDKAFLFFIIKEQEHVNQRDIVAVNRADNPPVVLLLGGIGRVQQPRRFNVHVGQLGELARRKPVGQDIAVHRLHVGKPHGKIDFLPRFQLAQQPPFLFVVALGHQQRHDVG